MENKLSILLVVSLVSITSVIGCSARPAAASATPAALSTIIATEFPASSTAVPLTTTSISPPVTTTSTAPPTTSTPKTTFTIPAGTDPEFTIDWPAPNGNSLPYLIFYRDVKYTAQHLWVRAESDNTVKIGFTDYGQHALGQPLELVLPDPGTVLKRDGTFGFILGGYMFYNVNAPVSGTVIQTNEDVRANPYLINQSPYDAGWLITVQMSNPDDLKLLMSEAEYANQCCPPCHCDN